MTDQTCTCGRPTRDVAYVCETCIDNLARDLGEIPWLEDELETTTTRQQGINYAGATSKGAEIPSPVHWGAADARRHLTELLASWVLFCSETHVANQSPDQTLPAPELVPMSRWLLWRLDGLALVDIGPEIIDELTNAIAKCRRVIDRPADKLYAGRCDSEYDAGEGQIVTCPEDLYVRVGAKVVNCQTCGTPSDIPQRRARLLKEAEEVLATAVEISRAVSWLGTEPLTADRVRQWASRDRLLARGHDKDGRPMYRVGDAIDLLSGTTKRGAA